MAEAARKRMTVEQFLRDESLEEGRYELIDGTPVMMSPPVNAHGAIAFALGAALRDALRAKPGCQGFQQAGVRATLRRDSFYVADLVVSCSPEPRTDREVLAPVLIVEILSPSTEATDRRIKLRDYRAVASVQEILIVDARQVFCEVHRRGTAGWTVDVLSELEDTLRLDSVGLSLPLGELYQGFDTAA